MRKISLLFVLAFVLSLPQITFAADNVRIVIDDRAVVSSGVQPEIKSGRVFVPIRFVTEQMGLGDEIGWDANTKEVTFGEYGRHRVGTTYLRFIAGSGDKILEETIDVGVASYLKNGNTMVSVRMITEAFKAQVQWDANTKTVYIHTEAYGRDAKADSYYGEQYLGQAKAYLGDDYYVEFHEAYSIGGHLVLVYSAVDSNGDHLFLEYNVHTDNYRVISLDDYVPQ